MDMAPGDTTFTGGTNVLADPACGGCGFCVTRCVSEQATHWLRQAGLRPTRQRIELVRILSTSDDGHFTAERLHGEAARRNISVALSTVYNTLQQLTEAGLLRRIPIHGAKAWFDTNLSDHHHIFVSDDETIIDLPAGCVTIGSLQHISPDVAVDRIEVMISLRRK